MSDWNPQVVEVLSVEKHPFADNLIVLRQFRGSLCFTIKFYKIVIYLLKIRHAYY
jgi:hypothetical protein